MKSEPVPEQTSSERRRDLVELLAQAIVRSRSVASKTTRDALTDRGSQEENMRPVSNND